MSFFDTLGASMEGAGNAISKKAKDFSETARINGEIGKRETRKNDCFRSAGEIVYHARKNGEEPNLDEVIQEIDRLETEIVGLREELRGLKGTIVCPGCGIEIERNASFCPNCGTSIPKGNLCANCGAVLDEGAKFCVNCGQKVGE